MASGRGAWTAVPSSEQGTELGLDPSATAAGCLGACGTAGERSGVRKIAIATLGIHVRAPPPPPLLPGAPEPSAGVHHVLGGRMVPHLALQALRRHERDGAELGLGAHRRLHPAAAAAVLRGSRPSRRRRPTHGPPMSFSWRWASASWCSQTHCVAMLAAGRSGFAGTRLVPPRRASPGLTAALCAGGLRCEGGMRCGCCWLRWCAGAAGSRLSRLAELNCVAGWPHRARVGVQRA